MAGRLSFSIAINLLTENFKRGTNQVKTAFRSMQMQFLTFAAALGAGGLGLSGFISQLITVARETSRVTTALKNVSGSMAQYADNQRYLLDLAKKYGLEINALTANYAKFTAAASISGMSMMDQRKVFESVSRACTAFGMSADDSNGVMLALSQMMSKGKISSEELRLQMGERLPIALQAMAKAAGVSVGGLDKLMKQGKLMSADVLPKFADALSEMIPNVDTDNLETSINRLKNAFTEFVNGTDAQSKYKALIDWLTGAVKLASDNIKSVVAYTIAAILVLVTSKLVNKIIISIAKAELAAKAAARRAARDAGVAFDEVAWKAQKASASIKMAFSKALGSLKALFISSIPTAVIAIIGAIIAKIVTMRQEANRIKRIFSEYKKESQLSGYTEEVVALKQQLQIINDKKQSQDNINKAQTALQKMLGVEHKSQEELNKLVAKRVELLKETARADFHSRKAVEAQESLRGIGDRVYNGKTIREMAPSWAAARGDRDKEETFKQKYGITSGIEELSFAWGDFKNDLDSYIEFSKILQHSNGELAKSTIKVNQLTEVNIPTTDPDLDKKKTPLQKEQESYNKQFKELGAQLEIGKISQAEYNKALGELNIKMYAQAKGTGDKEVLESEYLKARKEAAEKAINNQDKNGALVEFEKLQKDYNDKVKEAQAQHSKGLLTQKELNENIASLSIEAAKSAAGIKGIGDEADVFITTMQLNAKLLSSTVKVKPRDTTFDYKKTKVDIASENLDKAKELADKYKEEARVIGKTLSDEVANAMANVPTLEEALKLAQVQEDIKNLSKELNESLYSGVKDIASSSDRVVNAFSNLRDVMNDVDASQWERIMAIWNTMTSVVDSFLSICKMIENITELTNKLSAAKQIEAGIEQQVSNQKITNSTKEILVDTAASEAKKANSRGVVAANTAEAASAAGKSVAGIPFVGIALAAAAVAGIIALFATLPKFAKGGVITGGHTSGDKILARVNAGEMILNQGQQSNLFEAINSGNLGSGSSPSLSVTSKIRAKELILIINNELKSQGKKTIS